MTRLYALAALMARLTKAEPCPHWSDYLRQTASRG
ncbi:hypothetical protein SAMN05444002_3640 [Vannielia litorea]|uniref:Uncharacterized protein n=1 Tax=Vannielia litorea TaxID=1217970 RepID=A0A1N6IAX8_9RHOB|nr:hypothetical protein SAMN05444002_3640 [Vannielia litorea]